MSDIRSEKAAVRSESRRRIRETPAGQLRQEGEAVCRAVLESALWKQAERVLLFVPMKDEPDIGPLLESALMAGKELFLPKFDEESGCYRIGRVRELAADLIEGKYGIREPKTAVSQSENVDIILVPGLAFSESGLRLGRGAGYYDRLLVQVRGVRCGVCWSFTLRGDIPAEPHDCRVDMIVDSKKGLRQVDA